MTSPVRATTFGPGSVSEEHVPLAKNGILEIKSLSVTHFHLEWHEREKRLYHVPHRPAAGGSEIVAEPVTQPNSVADERVARTVAEAYFRGYRERDREIGPRPTGVLRNG